MKKLAIALGGLGGFNNHGAGVLEAIRVNNIQPQLITATSGQIIVASEFLKGNSLTNLFETSQVGGFLGLLGKMSKGMPGVFRPAIQENIFRWTPMEFMDSSIADFILPAQQFVPTLPEDKLLNVVDTFNNSNIGIVFNGYDPKKGEGILYGNTAAKRLLAEPLEPITLQAIKSALWLTFYGFDSAPNGIMDGAYHRSIILRELHGFEHVLIARPTPKGWKGDLPSNYYQVQDWQTKMWFSVGYEAEYQNLQQLNGLIDRGRLQGNKSELIEITMDQTYGFFDYFNEKTEVFSQAYGQMTNVVDRLK